MEDIAELKKAAQALDKEECECLARLEDAKAAAIGKIGAAVWDLVRALENGEL